MAESQGTLYGIEKLNNDNYQIWSCKVELMLTSEDLWEVIIEDPPGELTTAWKKKDAKAKAKIGLLVNNDQLTQ